MFESVRKYNVGSLVHDESFSIKRCFCVYKKMMMLFFIMSN